MSDLERLLQFISSFADVDAIRRRGGLGWRYELTRAMQRDPAQAATQLWVGVYGVLVAEGADGFDASKRAWRAARVAVLLCLFDCQQKEVARLLQVSASTAKGDMARVRTAIDDGCLRDGQPHVEPPAAP